MIVFSVIHLNFDELSKITFFSKQHTAKSIFVEWNRSSIVNKIDYKQKRSTEGCSKFKGPETRQVQERLVSTLEHMQVPKWDRTRCPEE